MALKGLTFPCVRVYYTLMNGERNLHFHLPHDVAEWLEGESNRRGVDVIDLVVEIVRDEMKGADEAVEVE